MAASLKDFDDISKLFQLPDSKLQEISQSFVIHLSNGLKGVQPGLAMLSSFVQLPCGTEKGTFLTLDIEATAFRVSQVDLDGRGKFTHTFEIFEISEKMKRGEVKELMGHVAHGVARFLDQKKIVSSPNVILPLGVTFGFPLKKTSPSQATLLAWSKGFDLKDGIGEDILGLIQHALEKKGLRHIRCVAIANDTVATMLAEAYSSGHCVLAAIFGVGTNGAIVDQNNIIVNTEWGAFKSPVIPTTCYDNKLQRESLQPRTQAFEKMVSWRYIGEIVRNVLLQLIDNSPPILFNGLSTDALNSWLGLDTYLVKLVEEAQNVAGIRSVLVEHLGFQPVAISDGDAEVVRKICEVVVTRAAKLAACAIAGAMVHKGYANFGANDKTAQKIGEEGKIHVALAGELSLLYPSFISRMRQALKGLIGSETENNISFQTAPDSGALGAALCAFKSEESRRK